MQPPKEAKYEAARRLKQELAASGTCTDYIDVQNAAKGHGLNREVDDLLVAWALRAEVNEICRNARSEGPSLLES
jgi:hypothetical protein